MKLTNKSYDVLKVISMLVGYIVTFAISVLEIWKVPNWELWTATISALGVFLGSCLLVSTKHYNEDMEEHADDDDYAERG